MTPAAGEAVLRELAVAAMRRLDALGLNRGSSGNLSLRCMRDGRDGMLITPTGIGADELQPAQLAWVGCDASVHGDWQPSSEWQLHQAVLARRADVQAVVHTHSVHATALACLQRELPPFHYMVAVCGAERVPCTPYHAFGSDALAAAVAQALSDRNACLMAHHGLVAAGAALAQAMKIAVEIEALCEVYLKALAVAEPAHLSAAQMAEVLRRFSRYGRARRN
ncbi:MAG TPA: class II aldolase/adducin family protein [Rubrivivax sp.]|mgnify:CR=1 FL=1|nr:class II aldolase/adducin family protein [Rubrivivax sp.]